jgi:hypothetical protein
MQPLNKNYAFLVTGFVLLLAGVYLWQENSQQPKSSKVTYGDLDKARRQEQTRSKFQREKVNVENFKAAPQIKEAFHPTETTPDEGLRLEASVSAAAKDIAETELSGMAIDSLENKINQKLLSEQKSAQMNAFQKQQYAEEYKKRAFAMGYVVELNEKLEVVKVQKVEREKTIKSNPVIDVDSIEEEEYEE